MTSRVTVRNLLEREPEPSGLRLSLLAGGDGLDQSITSPYPQKTGLALVGYQEYLRPGRVLVFGESEIRYLEGLGSTARTDAVRLAFAQKIPCLLLTAALSPPPEAAVEAERAHVPLLQTPLATPTAIAKLTSLLEDRLAERSLVHGVLLDILGLGVLLIGESGVGKSECALDLVVRGHRLVADDTVEVRRRSETILIGTCPDLTRHHMEVRGFGVINIHDLFGISATRASKRIELAIQLERWESGRDYDRLGFGEETYDLAGLTMPLIHLPVAPGRSTAILVEVAARNQLLKVQGHHAARELAERIDREIERAGQGLSDDWDRD